MKTHKQYYLIALFAIFAIVISSGGFYGCAPLPPIEEEGVEVEEKTPIELDPLAIAKSDSMTLVTHRSFAYTYYQQGDFKTARAHYDTVRTYDFKHRFNIYRRLADAYNNSQLQDSAVFAYEEGIKYFPDDAYLHTSLAHMYRNMDRYKDAIEQQKEALRIKENDFDYLISLADLYTKDEDYDGAIDTYEILAEIKPDDSEIKTKLDNLIKLHRDPAEYIEALRQGIEKFPDDLGRRLKYSTALFEQGRNEDAAREFKTYTELNPEDVRGWRGLAETSDNLERTQAAIAAYKKLVALTPNDLDVMVSIGVDYLHLNMWTETRSWAQKALNKDSGYGPAWVLMGDLYQKAADKASGDTPKYNDKLAFTIAYGLYMKASVSKDPDSRNNGERSVSILKSGELVPSKSDKFMHMKDVRPTGSAYDWINEDWPEVNYIDTYLSELK